MKLGLSFDALGQFVCGCKPSQSDCYMQIMQVIRYINISFFLTMRKILHSSWLLFFLIEEYNLPFCEQIKIYKVLRKSALGETLHVSTIWVMFNMWNAFSPLFLDDFQTWCQFAIGVWQSLCWHWKQKNTTSYKGKETAWLSFMQCFYRHTQLHICKLDFYYLLKSKRKKNQKTEWQQ